MWLKHGFRGLGYILYLHDVYILFNKVEYICWPEHQTDINSCFSNPYSTHLQASKL